LVIVDFGNVEKWKFSLGWHIGIQELANLVKNFSKGQRYLRRFYYGSDYGRKESSQELEAWSKGILTRAKMNGFEVVTKRVKYIHSADSVHGFEKKCDLDVEMAIDLFKEKDNYDTVVLFSGDGDLVYALRYLHEKFSKEIYIFGSRDHVGREVFDGKTDGVIKDILFAEDFEYRLSMERGRR
jgi:uncharacterized LabA/DUF88 family protein